MVAAVIGQAVRQCSSSTTSTSMSSRCHLNELAPALSRSGTSNPERFEARRPPKFTVVGNDHFCRERTSLPLRHQKRRRPPYPSEPCGEVTSDAVILLQP